MARQRIRGASGGMGYESWGEWRECLDNANPHAALPTRRPWVAGRAWAAQAARRGAAPGRQKVNEAADAGGIEPVCECGDRDFGAYRLTARGRRLPEARGTWG